MNQYAFNQNTAISDVFEWPLSIPQSQTTHFFTFYVTFHLFIVVGVKDFKLGR